MTCASSLEFAQHDASNTKEREHTMYAVSSKARILSATFAALLGLGSVAFAGGAFIASPSMQLVRLEPTVIVGHLPGVDGSSKVALACEQTPASAL